MSVSHTPQEPDFDLSWLDQLTGEAPAEQVPAADETPREPVPVDETPTIQLPTVEQPEVPVSSEDAPTIQLPVVSQPSVPEQEPELPGAAESEPEVPRKAKKKPRNPAKIGLILGIISGVLVLSLVLGVFVWGITLKNNGKIYPNVYVAGVNVGGMDRQQAIEAVDSAVSATNVSSTLKVQLPDRTLSFSPELTNIALDAEEAIEKAMTYGREGNPFSAVTGYFSSRGTEQFVDLQTILELDTDAIRGIIEDVAAEVEVDPVPTQVRYDAADETLVVDVGYPERRLDVEGLYEVVHNAFMNSDFHTLTWDYDEVPCETVDLTAYAEKHGTPEQNAYYDEETHTIVDSVPGYGFDLVDAGERISMAAAGSQVEIPLMELEPEITTEVLEKEMFGTTLFETSTEYVVNADRTNNLTLACQAINGLILNPGEVFSFNEVVGERTAEKGYKAATVYSGGQSLQELGGGVCQVASTLYYCTLHLDLEQIQREPHQFVVTYVPYGMDATIYWGHIDYQFRNTLSHPVKILANTDNGSVNVTFLGVRETDNKVKMEYTILATYPWQEVEELDETKEVGYRQVDVTPYTGYKVVTHKIILDAEGNELSRKEEAYSTYDKRDQKVIVGPSELPEDSDPWPDLGDDDFDGTIWPDFGDDGFGSDDDTGIPDPWE